MRRQSRRSGHSRTAMGIVCLVNAYILKDSMTNLHQGYGFVEFRSEEDADYAIKILNMIKLYGKPILVNKDVDEKLLYDTFSSFGVIFTNPKTDNDRASANFCLRTIRDVNNAHNGSLHLEDNERYETGNSRGFGFISYDFWSKINAIDSAMNGQYLCNRQITVSYAYKKDTQG